MVERVRIGGFNNPRSVNTTVKDTTGSDMARAFGDAGLVLTDEFIKQQREKDLVTAVEERGEAIKRIDTITADMDPADPNYASQVASVYDEEVNSALGNSAIRGKAVKTQFGLDLKGMSTEAASKALVTQRASTQQRAAAALDDARNEFLNQVTEDPDGAEAFQAEFVSKYAKLAEVFPPSQREAILDQVTENAVEARIRGLANAGRLDEANVMAKQSAGMFAPSKNRDIQTSILQTAAKQRSERVQAASRGIADLQIGIEDGTQGLDAIEKAGASGLFEGNEQKRVELLRRLRKRDEGQLADQIGIQDILGRFSAGAGLKNSAEADVAFKAILSSMDEASPEDVAKVGAYITQESGVVPETVRRLIKVGNNTTDPERLARASELHAAMTNGNDTIDTGGGDRVETAAFFADSLDLSPREAADLTIENEPDRAGREARRVQYSEQEFNPIKGLKRAGFKERQLPPGMAGEYNRVVEELFVRTGDMDSAEAMASQRINRIYGVSSVNGRDEVVRKPPEQFGIPSNLGGPSSDPKIAEMRVEVLEEAINSRLSELGVKAQFPAGSETTKQVAVKDDRGLLTKSRTETTSTSELPEWKLELIDDAEQPQWSIMVRNEFGGFSPVDIFLGLSQEEAEATKTFGAFAEKQRKKADSTRQKRELVQGAISDMQESIDNPRSFTDIFNELFGRN